MKNSIKIALLGATGKAGQSILQQLLQEGYAVNALIRNPEKYTIIHPQLSIVMGDVKEYESVQQLVQGCTVVISAIGQPKEEPLMSSLAAINILKGMDEYHVQRYMFLAGITIDVPGDAKSNANIEASKWMKDMFPEVVADKQRAYDIVRESNVSWTMIRLPWIEQTSERRGLLVSLEDCLGARISTADLADFIVTAIETDNYSQKAPFVASN
ncbi:NAD(P)-dependent oxidoreductase [Flavobacterium sp. '19STA2R22 D10 B1']|uniref:NAD(P)-dependent oxidoreductase n=1 Tax=Flavobacterium aerium TaxID=3037261 RepID=UPI00278C0508|nr:NAD(P)H-binding protein [Flavobacterium sp. '19STA2R22 D10 B1']